jgi:hypothetical protein
VSMRWLPGVLVLLCAHGAAFADPAADAGRLAKEGEALARAGKYAEAVARFRAADAAAPRAVHDCLIALAFRRAGAWGAAELHAQRCHERATAADPEPGWGAKLRSELASQVLAAGLAPLTVEVAPEAARAAAQVSVSTFGPETFAPRTIFVPVGAAVMLVVEAEGFAAVRRQVTVEAGGAVERVAMTATGAVTETAAGTETATGTATGAATGAATATVTDTDTSAATATATVTAAPRERERQLLPWIAAGVAGVGLVTGATFHVLAVGTAGDLDDATTGAAWDRHEGDFDRQRAIAIAGYGVAALAGGVAAYGFLRGDRGVTVAAQPRAGGAIVGVSWSGW